jgi:ribosomal protein L11 methyltransferase
MRQVTPRFRVAEGEGVPDERTIVLTASGAFGDGTHETTQMCLQALVAFAPPPPFRLLDVGSGTGILSLAAAKLAPDVSALGIEIDPEANRVATENARRNGVAERVSFGTTWPEGAFPFVIANILRAVLVELAPAIVGRCAPSARLVLSGLVSTDVPAIVACYAPLLGGARPEIFERGPWRTLVWRIA